MNVTSVTDENQIIVVYTSSPAVLATAHDPLPHVNLLIRHTTYLSHTRRGGPADELCEGFTRPAPHTQDRQQEPFVERGLIVNMYMASPRREGILLAHVEAPPAQRDRGTRDAAQRHLLRHETVRFI